MQHDVSELGDDGESISIELIFPLLSVEEEEVLFLSLSLVLTFTLTLGVMTQIAFKLYFVGNQSIRKGGIQPEDGSKSEV